MDVVRRLMLRGLALALLAPRRGRVRTNCGNRVKINVQSIPNACTADATPQ